MTDHVLLSELELKEKMKELLSKAECEVRKSMKDALFAYDGFFPLYTTQKIKVLMIGREAYGTYSTYRKPEEKSVSIIDVAYDEYRHNELFRGGCISTFDKKALTRRSVKYPARNIALAYSIITGDWNVTAEKVRDIASMLGTPDGISYAYYNFSKLLNQNEDKSVRANRKMIRSYALLDHKMGILRKEIELIDPDVIITQGFNELCGYIDFNSFSNLGETSHKDSDKKTRKDSPLIIEKLYGKRTIDIIDVRHFSGCNLAYWKETCNRIRDYLKCKD